MSNNNKILSADVNITSDDIPIEEPSLSNENDLAKLKLKKIPSKILLTNDNFTWNNLPLLQTIDILLFIMKILPSGIWNEEINKAQNSFKIISWKQAQFDSKKLIDLPAAVQTTGNRVQDTIAQVIYWVKYLSISFINIVIGYPLKALQFLKKSLIFDLKNEKIMGLLKLSSILIVYNIRNLVIGISKIYGYELDIPILFSRSVLLNILSNSIFIIAHVIAAIYFPANFSNYKGIIYHLPMIEELLIFNYYYKSSSTLFVLSLLTIAMLLNNKSFTDPIDETSCPLLQNKVMLVTKVLFISGTLYNLINAYPVNSKNKIKIIWGKLLVAIILDFWLHSVLKNNQNYGTIDQPSKKKLVSHYYKGLFLFTTSMYCEAFYANFKRNTIFKDFNKNVFSSAHNIFQGILLLNKLVESSVLFSGFNNKIADIATNYLSISIQLFVLLYEFSIYISMYRNHRNMSMYFQHKINKNDLIIIILGLISQATILFNIYGLEYAFTNTKKRHQASLLLDCAINGSIPLLFQIQQYYMLQNSVNDIFNKSQQKNIDIANHYYIN